MLNTNADVPEQERTEIINTFIDRLVVSGYCVSQIKEIIESGLRGYLRKLKNASATGSPLYRPAASTLKGRLKKKLTEKTSWYKKKPQSTNTRKQKEERLKKQKQKPILTVMFVPKTVGGKLAKELRDVDNKLSEITEDRVKIVERSGIKLRSLFHKANPWGNTKCSKSECLVCTNPYNESFNCDKRNVTYKTFCLKCKENAKKDMDAGDDIKEPLKTYYGETHCSARERGAQHVRDYQNKSEDSHMYKHFSDTHNNENREDIKFGMTVLKQHFSSFSRQVHESVLIFLNPHVLNSKSGMYNRCQVPRLSVMVGDQVASDQDQVRYDQVELDLEVANIRNKHHLASSDEETRPNKRQKRWHVNKERNKKKKKDHSEDNTVSPSAELKVLKSPLSKSSEAETHVVKENRGSTKHFPVFNHNDKSNANFNSHDKIEATKVKFEESPKHKTQVGAKKKSKLNSNVGNNSILKFITPMRGKPSTKPNVSSDPP